MTTYEIIETLLQAKKEKGISEKHNDAAIFETAQLVSGSIVFPLYGALWANYFDMESTTKHLEALHDSEDYIGLAYFIILLADAVDYELPPVYFATCTFDTHVKALSDAIISDWLDYDENSATEEIELF
jgi:hypothetical protein